MTEHELEDWMTDIYKKDKSVSKYIGKIASLHKIRVNDMEVPTSLDKSLDQLTILYRSPLYPNISRYLDTKMKEYHKTPEEKQIRVLPDDAKADIVAWFDGLKAYAEYYETYLKNPRKAQLINDESDTSKTVLDVDYFKNKSVDIDFPYKSIPEIMKDKSLSSKEKLRMTEVYMELKYPDEETITEKPEVEVEESGKLTEALVWSDKEDDTPKEVVVAKVSSKKAETKKGKTAKQLWANIKQTHKKQSNIQKLVWRQPITIRNEKHYYIPAKITSDPFIIKELKEKYIPDVNVHFKITTAKLKPENTLVYFFRVRESELKNFKD